MLLSNQSRVCTVVCRFPPSMSSFVGRFVTGTISRIYQQTTSLFGRGHNYYGYQQHYLHSLTQQPLPGGGMGGSSFVERMLELQQQQQFIRGKHSMKTHKGIAKRFTVRGKGSLRRTRAGRQHNTGWKSRGRINKLGLGGTVRVKKIDRALKICLGVLSKQKR